MTNKGKMIESAYSADLTKRATLVIFYLINRADQSLTCFPGVKTIATECNISPRTVQRALIDLEAAGFLERESRFHEKGGQRSNLYYLQIPVIIKKIQEVDFEVTSSDVKLKNSSIDHCKLEIEITEVEGSESIRVLENNKTNSYVFRIVNYIKLRFFKFMSWGV